MAILGMHAGSHMGAASTGVRKARFVTGSIMKHVLVMAGTGAIGLMAVFAVDLLNLIYIAHTGIPSLTAAMGFAGAVSGLQIAVSIGMTIGLGASVGRHIGAGQHEHARRIASSFITVMIVTAAILGVLTAITAPLILHFFGASGSALEAASSYLHIVSPFFPLVVIGMGTSALLRSVGDAKGSMHITLIGAIIAAMLDPLFILVMDAGMAGAAYSTLISRTVVALIGYHRAKQHDIIGLPSLANIWPDTKQVGNIAGPAILTNLATPVGGAWVTTAMSRFGLEAVAGQAAVDRIIVVAFAMIFALSGSVGPIMAQNLGAGQICRVKEVLSASIRVILTCVLITWFVLWLMQDLLVEGFHVTGSGATLIHLFCTWTVVSYFFLGFLFVANSAFNNLGHPIWSTAFNWGRATLGTIPFVIIGSHFGAAGVQIGQATGAAIFGISAIATAFKVVTNMPEAPLTEPSFPADIPAISQEAAMAELDEINEDAA
jgi:putative MATE family efflux protein